jgi:membrane protein implicated in regulation of membrane protease activity
VTLADFYLFCFVFGFLFSVMTVVSGHLHLDMGGDGHGHDFGGHDNGGAHPDTGHSHHQVSPWNLGTGAAFLAWFGGTGYLATKFYNLWFVSTLFVALAAGLFGGWLVYLFLAKVLLRSREELDPADYEMVGVLGQVSGTIRSEGIGEILFSRDGARRASPARSEDGTAIAPGEEVVVTRYENGVAYVRRWNDLIGN